MKAPRLNMLIYVCIWHALYILTYLNLLKTVAIGGHIHDFSGYKMNMKQVGTHSLYSATIQGHMKKAIPCIKASQRINYFRINFTIDLQDFYIDTGNHCWERKKTKKKYKGSQCWRLELWIIKEIAILSWSYRLRITPSFDKWTDWFCHSCGNDRF